MVQLGNTLIGFVLALIFLVLWRWAWIRSERRRILRVLPMYGDERFDRSGSDEGDQFFSGRIIRRLRASVVEGRVEIHWEFHKKYVHRGFVLTGKCRRNQGMWEPLMFEGHQDNGSWSECFNYGESCSYLFTVKKTYRFFFGLLPNDHIETVFDQLSFALRKGKFLKEKKELVRDRKELLAELKEYCRLENDLRTMAKPRDGRPALDSTIAKLEARYNKKSAVSDFVEKKKTEIMQNKAWSEERRQEEVDLVERLAEEVELEESV